MPAPTQIAHYRITAKLGEGGMGVVYRAHDSRLARDVAIKVLPDNLARDPERMARFEREARTLAALNHPNIAAVYGIEQGALVMELVEGPTLADRLRSGPIPVDEAIRYARQMADGLEAAHDKGITHRDIKPANIKITPEGQVKLLDFGLATAMQSSVSAPASDPENSPTLTAVSGVGVIMGTAGYMSPEQARGLAVDKRADVWSFGVVLYEMLTGAKMFAGETVSDTLAHVLTKDPDLAALPAETPAWVRRLLARSLQHDRKKRLRDIGDAFYEEGVPSEPVPGRPVLPKWLIPAIAAAGLMGAAGGWLLLRPAPVEPPLRAFSFPAESLSPVNFTRRAVISPNGRHVAYVAADKLWIRDLDSEQARALEGTDGAQGPFWSPDSLQVAFNAGTALKRVSPSGGMPFTLATLSGPSYRGGCWSPDRRSIIVSLAFVGLMEVPAEGGAPKQVLKPGAAESFYGPSWIPTSDGRILVAGQGNRRAQSVVLIDLANGKVEKLLSGGYPAYAASGHVLFQTEPGKSGLWSVAFAPRARKLLGEPVPIVNGGADVSVSSDGTLAWSPMVSERRQFVWRDRAGARIGEAGAPGDIANVTLSPDASRVAYSAVEQGNLDVWILDLIRQTKTRFTFDPAADIFATWSPSGKEIAWGSQRDGSAAVYVQPSDGGGQPMRVILGTYPESWSPDGSTLLMEPVASADNFDIYYARRKPDGAFEAAVPFLNTPFSERRAQFSPDGRFVAYTSDESGRREVYVRAFPDSGGKRQISADGGGFPRWRRDGREIFYVKNGSLFAVPLTMAAGALTVGAPVELFRNPGLPLAGSNYTYDVAPDGKRFLIAEPVQDGKSQPPAIHIIENWTALLRRKPIEPTE